MPEYIQKRHLVEHTNYSHSFHYDNDSGAGYGFDCDKEGNTIKWDTGEPDPERMARVQRFIDTGKDDDGRKLIYEGIVERYHSYWEPSIIKCETYRCTGEIALDHNIANTCDKCGTDYNLSGQRLAPREQWGEETGESPSDIMNANRYIGG